MLFFDALLRQMVAPVLGCTVPRLRSLEYAALAFLRRCKRLRQYREEYTALACVSRYGACSVARTRW